MIHLSFCYSFFTKLIRFGILNFDKAVIIDVIIPRGQPIIPTVSSVVNPDGTMSSRPLEDMAPFLDREEYKNNLYVDEA